jgi:hypothetical protein
MVWLIALASLVWVALVVVFSPIALLFALPWIAATVWTAQRAGWSSLWSDNGKAFPSQSRRLRGFGGR